MVSSNNRELARSAFVFEHEGAARAALACARLLPAGTTSLYVDGTGLWRWRLRLEDSPFAVSSRAYQRRLECQATVSLFLRAAAAADLPDRVAVFRHTSVAHGPDVTRQGRAVDARTVRPAVGNGRLALSLHGPDMRRSPARARPAV